MAEQGLKALRSISVADVGDGLCMDVKTTCEGHLCIDCGSTEGAVIAIEGARRIASFPYSPCDTLVMSHYHTDHYNGLLNAVGAVAGTPRPSVKCLYYPRMPDFPAKQRLALAFLAVGIRTLGGHSGLMELDLLHVVRAIVQKPFMFRSLAQHDTFVVGGETFHVLWPPRCLEKKPIKSIVRALRAFEVALEKDDELARIHDRLRDSWILADFARDQEREGAIFEAGTGTEGIELQAPQPLPGATQEANKQLRKAANALTLCFCGDRGLLFLGDADGPVIKKVAERLDAMRRIRFAVLVTPHHGTKWARALTRVVYACALTSNGKTLAPGFKAEFKQYARWSLSTHAMGDIHLHMPSDGPGLFLSSGPFFVLLATQALPGRPAN